jgi:hypothetical protein
MPREQFFHIGENVWRRLRQLLDAPKELIGVDRTDVDPELFGFFEEARVAVDGEKRRLQSFGTFAGHTGRRSEWAGHAQQRRFGKRDQRSRVVIGREFARGRNIW